jgi:phage terminase small subunit
MYQVHMAEIHPGLLTPANYKLGPAMLRLNDRQRAFVIAMLEMPGIDNTSAARAAGYSDDKQIKVTAYRLAHDEDVLEAIYEESKRRLRSGAVMAVSRLLEIANDTTAEKKDQLKAIEMVLNRTGFHAVTEQKIDVTHRDESNEEVLKKITLLANNAGLDPKKLLGNFGITIDAEFKEVPAETDDLSDIW